MHTLIANGKLLRNFLVIKCSIKKADMRGVQVLHALHKDLNAAYEDEDGEGEVWSYNIFNIVIPLKGRDGKMHDVEFWRPFLKNRLTGTVISCQEKAWNDTVGMYLYYREVSYSYRYTNGVRYPSSIIPILI